MLTLILVWLIGAVAVGLVFLAIRRATTWHSVTIGTVVASLAVLVYLPHGLTRWPGLDVFALTLSMLLLLPFALAVFLPNPHGQARRTHTPLHWAPLSLLAFFVFLALVNAILIVVAENGLPKSVANWLFPRSAVTPEHGVAATSSRFPGTVIHDYQEKENQFNAYLDARRSQAVRGWHVRKGWLQVPAAGERGVLKIEVTNRHGAPISDAQVHGQFVRMANQHLDQSFVMQPHGAGIYLAEFVPTVPGRWDVLIEIRRGEAVHEVHATTVIPPKS